jgi:hypothetical protein
VEMARRVLLLSATTACAAVAVGSVPASSELAGPGTIRVTSREITREVVDVGLHGPSAGDLLVRSALLYNRGITSNAIGHEEVICTYLGAGAAFGDGSRNCVATVFLRRGKLVAEGAVHNLYIYELPVLGGTGIYDNVRGTLTVTFLGNGPRRELLLFRLTV